jgi:predicted RNA-binding Zn-ribbon protein involved in translation (DUF1610 family)
MTIPTESVRYEKEGRMADIFDYYSDDWRSKTFTCPGCGWQGAADGMDMEPHAELADYSCPECDHMILIVNFPTIEETRKAAAAELRRIDQVSYELMVFDAAATPRDRARFLSWYGKQSEWEESHGYNDPEVPAPALKKWFREIIKTFPPMNGPLASDPDNPKVTDYSLGRSVIYGAFAWSDAEAAYKQVKKLAAKHGVGFFDVSGDEEDIWWPVPEWKFACEARGEIPLPLDLTFAEVLNKLDPQKNSFYILEHDNRCYIQCGGSKAACTVEFRFYDSSKNYKHYVVGHADASTQTACVRMSEGVVNVQKGEVLNKVEAAELFDLFFAKKKFPKKFTLREKDG